MSPAQDVQKQTMTMRNRVTVIAFMIAGLSFSPVCAQNPPAEDPHTGHSMTPSPTVPSNQGSDGGAERRVALFGVSPSWTDWGD